MLKNDWKTFQSTYIFLKIFCLHENKLKQIISKNFKSHFGFQTSDSLVKKIKTNFIGNATY